MRTETVQINYYKFNELSEKAQEKALDYYRSHYMDDSWYEGTLEFCKQPAEIMGIEIDKIYFSGFCNQGDGACFEGTYSFEKGAIKKIKEKFPTNEEVQRIAVDLYKLQRRYFYSIEASVKHRGHYYHEYCTDISVSRYDPNTGHDLYVDEDLENEVKKLLRDYMGWIYKTLKADYYYLTSDEVIKENFKANENEFLETGTIA